MKKPFIYLLTAGLAVSMIVNTGTVGAVGETRSDATVTFTSPVNNDLVPPLDPRNPGSELESPDGTLNEEAGDLTLDYVSNFMFNSVELDLNDEEIVTYGSIDAPSLQVSDRRQTGEGWNVIAELSSFEDENENSSLNNAAITLNEGTSISPRTEAEGEETNLKNPNVETPITLVSNEDPVRIVEAKARPEGTPLYEAEGLGTWINTWLAAENGATANENVILTIPARTATPGTHKATITWTLTSGPYSL